MNTKHPEDRSPLRQVQLILDSRGDAALEAEGFLARRLKAVALVMFIGLTLFLVREIYFVLHTHPIVPVHIVLCILMGAVFLGLHFEWIRGLSALRATEVFLFLSVALFMSAKYYIQMVRATGPEAPIEITDSIHELTTGCFTLAILYGLIIPGRWQKAAFVVVPMLLLPLFVPLHAAYVAKAPAAMEIINVDLLSGSLMVVLTGAMIALYGSHVVYSLKRETTRLRRMGQYQLTERFGAGGMGEVWKARHALLQRPAAIKLIRLDGRIGHEEITVIQKRFAQEARATAQLRSPHTVEVYDFGVTPDGAFYMAMEYLEGMNLRDLVKELGPLPPERVIHLLDQVCQSLAEAHALGLIHRDVKPANIFTCRMGLTVDFVKVLDFGLVLRRQQITGADSRLTQVGTVGTPAFISPEQLEEKDDLDGRADLYSLGCVAFWLLTGRYVFEADNGMQMAIDHLKTEPRAPSQATSQAIPPEFDAIVLRLLSKSPDQRFRTAGELSEALRAVPLDQAWTQNRARSVWKSEPTRPD
ncbi:MAG TPA: serine/threonine protein kinase [Planctomycetes bacterium]|nr:serine/threonine protein kinase [Planctomycetota bacterium]